jgi:hypothetical protein
MMLIALIKFPLSEFHWAAAGAASGSDPKRRPFSVCAAASRAWNSVTRGTPHEQTDKIADFVENPVRVLRVTANFEYRFYSCFMEFSELPRAWANTGTKNSIQIEGSSAVTSTIDSAV